VSGALQRKRKAVTTPALEAGGACNPLPTEADTMAPAPQCTYYEAADASTRVPYGKTSAARNRQEVALANLTGGAACIVHTRPGEPMTGRAESAAEFAPRAGTSTTRAQQHYRHPNEV
jgi:hypothetical protein